jgi:hypothetical protein
MKTITFNTYWGNFNYNVTTQTPDGGSEALETEGLANIAYRPAASAAMKAFFTKEQVAAWKKAKATAGDDADSLRRSVDYNDANVETFRKGAQDKLDEIVKDKKLAPIVLTVTGQHEYGADTNVATKEATELWTKLQGQPEAQFAATLAKLGLTSDYDDASGIAACRNFMLDIKRKAVEAAKAGLAGL